MVLCVYACANCMQNTRFKPMHVIEAKLCRLLVFQMSFRNIQRQKSYRKFLGDRSELWPSIYIVLTIWLKKMLNSALSMSQRKKRLILFSFYLEINVCSSIHILKCFDKNSFFFFSKQLSHSTIKPTDDMYAQ